MMKGVDNKMLVNCKVTDCIYNRNMYGQYDYCGYIIETGIDITIGGNGKCKEKEVKVNE